MNEIQIVVNVNLLREINKRKLINIYARRIYNSPSDVTDDKIIKENLKQLLDWDENGDEGLGIYCSKFEEIKKKDWIILINFIKDNAYQIKERSSSFVKRRKKESLKVLYDEEQRRYENRVKNYLNPDYKSTRGKPTRPCTYEGRTYSSRQECMYMEGITQNQLYRYLEKTGQV